MRKIYLPKPKTIGDKIAEVIGAAVGLSLSISVLVLAAGGVLPAIGIFSLLIFGTIIYGICNL